MRAVGPVFAVGWAAFWLYWLVAAFRARHPIYAGILAAGAGTAVALSWLWLTAVVLAGVYFLYSATVEERYLAEQFPDAYPHYRRSTRMLVPFIL
jgi:protein-S-isoprenylcysteine O-methyltransferase Ste14